MEKKPENDRSDPPDRYMLSKHGESQGEQPDLNLLSVEKLVQISDKLAELQRETDELANIVFAIVELIEILGRTGVHSSTSMAHQRSSLPFYNEN